MKKRQPIFATLPDEAPSKGQRRKAEILDSAIECFATLGIDQTSYEDIAKRCGVSRPLVVHYFPDKEFLSDSVIKFIRLGFQSLAVRALAKERTPKRQLESYIKSTFQWIEKHPSHGKVWLLFYYYCGIRPPYRKTNTELVRMGQDRIAALIEQLNPRLSPKEAWLRAKMIQITLTGALVSAGTEVLPMARTLFIQRTIGICLAQVEHAV